MTRWLAKNREALNAEQLEAAENAIAAITPDVYRFDEPELQVRTQITAVVNRLKTVLSEQQFFDFAVAGAKHIPV
jgi:hypothetical protein